jgi:hypothetical protein
LLNIKDPGLLAQFRRYGFIATSSAYFQPILDTTREIKLID